MLTQLRTLAAIAALAFSQAGQPPAGKPAQPPTVKSGVEVIAVDVEVVGRDGEPVAGLQPADFEVRIDGRSRRVVSADFLRYGTPGASGGAAAPVVTVPGATPLAARRLYLIAVDEHSFHQGAAMAAMRAAAGFIDKLRPDDLVGVFAYPTGAVHVDFTTDHKLARGALDRIQGLFEPPRSQYHLTLSEIVDIDANDADVFARAVARECHGDVICPEDLRNEAKTLARFLEMRIAQSLGGLQSLIEGLADVPERKTVVLVSGGLIANDRIGGRPDVSGLTRAVGRQALRANVNLYVLHLDTSFMDAFSPRNSQRSDVSTLFREENLSAQGLEMVAGAAGGAVMRVQAGTLDSSFARVLKETSAHYVLGVAVDETDRDGKTHGIVVRYKKRGATLRSRTLVAIPRPGEIKADVVAEPEDLMPAEPQVPLIKPGAGTPSLTEILRSAAKYLDAYEQQAMAIVSEETYLQKTPEPDPDTSAVSRQLRSDMLIVAERTVGWVGFRDVFEVDGKPVHDRTERLQTLFMHPLPDSMSQARRIVVEGSRLNLRSDIHRTINTPMMALRFLRFVDQRRSKFAFDGLQTIDGVVAAVVRFEERLKPRMIESDDEAPAKGTFWIDPASGRVLKTELLLDTGKKSARLRVRVRVGYAPNAQVETWVPVSMDEEYRLGKGALAVEGHATYANFRKFRVETQIKIKKDVPLPDL